jgi:hypothetical protein
MATRKTIDNLGVETYTRYAEDKQQLDEKLVKEARFIPPMAEVDVTLPAYPSEMEALLGAPKRQILWADFPPPPLYHEQKRRLYTTQIIPSLGSEDKKAAQAQRITDLVANTKRMKEEKEKIGAAKEETRELQDQEKEAGTFLNLFGAINKLEKQALDIKSRLYQYQKG